MMSNGAAKIEAFAGARRRTFVKRTPRLAGGADPARFEMDFERMSLGATVGKPAAVAPAKPDGGGSGAVGMVVLKEFNQ
jgi:hypothetical protein